jgi:hypothetical protein
MSYKANKFGSIRFHDGSWYIDPRLDDRDDILKNYFIAENLAEIVWSNIDECVGCAGCSPGYNMNIIGKEYEKICGYNPRFKDPDADTLDCVKKLLECRQKIIAADKV